MTTTKKGAKFRTDALESAHHAAAGLISVGAIDKSTMRDFDMACLTQIENLEPNRIKKIREEAHMSQATFALALNVGKTLISQWERGEKKPSGPSLKLLSLAARKGIATIL